MERGVFEGEGVSMSVAMDVGRGRRSIRFFPSLEPSNGTYEIRRK